MDDNREVIELINKLQKHQASTGCEIKIDLPQIVVVGAQSCGKSSVLDGLIGFSILPRGSGTVTKCPIIVQLINTQNPAEEGIEFVDEGVQEIAGDREEDSESSSSYSSPEEDDGQENGRIRNHDLVRRKIAQRMEANGGTITDNPVIIKVYSRDVVTLTVVDLPGIKRLASAGEQDNQAQLIFDLSRKYIRQKNAIILAVSPANYEICNSDGLLLAKEADPEGDRTLGVLTKLDLMDAGTEGVARALLEGESPDISVKLGMIGLVNRSQRDIENNVSVEDQMEKEKFFLQNTYPDLEPYNGVPYLRKRLQDLLVGHIQKCLPDIMRNMKTQLEECKKRLDSIPNLGDATDRYKFASRIVQRFERAMKTELEGDPRNPDYEHEYGGIKIKSNIFEKRFAEDMVAAGLKTDAAVTDDMILNAFRNSGGFDALFLSPEAVFRKLGQRMIKHVEAPATRCADRVDAEIRRIAERYLKEDELGLFPELRKAIKDVVYNMLDDKLDQAKREIVDYVRTQASMVFSLDKPFLLSVSEIQRAMDRILHGDRDPQNDDENPDPAAEVPNASNDEDIWTRLKDPQTILLIKKMVHLYFEHVKKQIQDYVPKLVADRLIAQFSSEEDGKLRTQLGISVMQRVDELVKLPNDVNERRRRDVRKKKDLITAIDDVKDLYSGLDFDDYYHDDDGSADGADGNLEAANLGA